MSTAKPTPDTTDYVAMEQLLNAVTGSTAIAKAVLQSALEAATEAYANIQDLDDRTFDCPLIDEDLVDQYNSLGTALESIEDALLRIDPDLSRIRCAIAAAKAQAATLHNQSPPAQA